MAILKSLIHSFKKIFGSKKRVKRKNPIRNSGKRAEKPRLKRKTKKMPGSRGWRPAKTYRASSKKTLRRKSSLKKKIKTKRTTASPGRTKTKTKRGIGKAAARSRETPAKEVLVGEITHYFSRIEVVVLKMVKGQIAVGDRLHIKGSATDFIQPVSSLQIENNDVRAARRGQLVGLKVKQKAKEKDQVWKLLP